MGTCNSIPAGLMYKLGDAAGTGSTLMALWVTAAFPHHTWHVASLDCQWNAAAAAAGSSRPAQSGQRHGRLDESWQRAPKRACGGRKRQAFKQGDEEGRTGDASPVGRVPRGGYAPG